MLCTMTCDQVLQVIRFWDTLRLGSPQEVLGDGVTVVAERDLNRPFETVNVWIVAGTLVRLVLLHQGDEFISGPTLGLEVIVV